MGYLNFAGMSDRIEKYILTIFLLCTVQLSHGQTNNKLTETDSLLVLKKVYMFDFDKNKFEDIDEPFLENLWSSDKPKAKSLFDKAIKLISAPIWQRMILASYFYQDKEFGQVISVLKSCKNRADTLNVFKIMDSYQIKFSDFNIKKKLVENYGKDIKYK
jgi:hypothetical protein